MDRNLSVENYKVPERVHGNIYIRREIRAANEHGHDRHIGKMRERERVRSPIS